MNARILAALLVGVTTLSLSACATRPKPAAGGVPEATVPPSRDSDPRATPAPVGVRPGSQEDLAVTAGDRVFFEVDSATLGTDARETLRRQAAWLNQHASTRAQIEGHADERGTREYNLALGARRANAARQFLVSQGVATSRIDTISYGKERPIDSGSNEEAWARNRNAHTVVIGIGQ